MVNSSLGRLINAVPVLRFANRIHVNLAKHFISKVWSLLSAMAPQLPTLTDALLEIEATRAVIIRTTCRRQARKDTSLAALFITRFR